MASPRYGINFQLPSLEDSPYLFREKYYSQELLSYKEGEPRLVYIYIYLIFIRKILIFNRNELNVSHRIVNIRKPKNALRPRIVITILITIRTTQLFQSKKRYLKTNH